MICTWGGGNISKSRLGTSIRCADGGIHSTDIWRILALQDFDSPEDLSHLRRLGLMHGAWDMQQYHIVTGAALVFVKCKHISKHRRWRVSTSFPVQIHITLFTSIPLLYAEATTRLPWPRNHKLDMLSVI